MDDCNKKSIRFQYIYWASFEKNGRVNYISVPSILKDMKKIKLTQSQKEKLTELWFIYGNNGEKTTLPNHRFLQDLIVNGEDTREFRSNPPLIPIENFYLSKELLEKVDDILK